MLQVLPLQVDGAAPSAPRCVFGGHAAAASCAPRGPGAELPVGPAASCGPRSALCFPAAAAGSLVSMWTRRAH